MRTGRRKTDVAQFPGPPPATGPAGGPVGAAPLVLPARLDLTAARRLTRELRDRGGSPLRIDASRVEVLGGLCLQVLLAARQHWQQRRVPLDLSARSPAFDAALAQFGLTAAALEVGTTP